VSNVQIDFCSTPPVSPPVGMPKESNWYAIHTVARHEKRVARQLEEKRIATFLPLLEQIHRWSDRRCKVEVPLFSCYAFIHVAATAERRQQVLQTQGVLGLVGSESQGTPIPDAEIENLRRAIREKAPCTLHPFVDAGKRVRIRGGSLDGLEGILVGPAGDESLVVSVKLLRRSVSMQVRGYDIEAV